VDDEVGAAGRLSSSYLSGSQLAGRAVDLLDTAAARVKISISSVPDGVEDAERNIQTLQRQRAALARDIGADVLIDDGQLAALDAQLDKSTTQLQLLTTQWQQEKAIVERVVQLRQQLASCALETATVDSNEALDQASLKQQIRTELAELASIQGDNPQIHYEVSPDVVARVIADWTGIPLGKMVRDEAASVLTLADNLKQRIRGQDHAIDAIDSGVRAAKAGVNNPDTPLGVFLLVGPSGVGKTEMALGVADMLFGGERFLTTINMSEFQEKHSVSRLIGSPPGYVGFGEGGVLTEAVRQKPYSLVLLDEVEKADLEVMNLFYQVFDKGMLSDGEGQLVNFRNSALFLTSNLATDIITDMCSDGQRPDPEQLMAAIRPVLSKHFKPALLARMQIVPFYTLDSSVMADIARLKLDKVVDRVANSQQLQMHYSDAVVETIAQRCQEVESGARNIDHIINGSLLPQLATQLLESIDSDSRYTRLDLDIDQAGDFSLTFSK